MTEVLRIGLQLEMVKEIWQSLELSMMIVLLLSDCALLGETYEADYPDKGLKFFSEKVTGFFLLTFQSRLMGMSQNLQANAATIN